MSIRSPAEQVATVEEVFCASGDPSSGAAEVFRRLANRRELAHSFACSLNPSYCLTASCAVAKVVTKTTISTIHLCLMFPMPLTPRRARRRMHFQVSLSVSYERFNPDRAMWEFSMSPALIHFHRSDMKTPRGNVLWQEIFCALWKLLRVRD